MARRVLFVLNSDVTLRVVPILEGIEWEPNVPSARFVADDDGFALLLLQPHSDDPDPSLVAIFWTGVVDSQFGGPNDEGRHRHPLYDHGLLGLLWAGEVIETETAPGLRRFIIPIKESIVEVRARQIGWSRMDPAVDVWAAIERLKLQ